MQDSELFEFLKNQNTLLNETITSLQSTIIELRKEIKELREANLEVVNSLNIQIEELTRKLKEAEDNLNTDSHNSNFPPSTDIFGKTSKKKEKNDEASKIKQTQSMRKASGQKAGGQPRHTGSTKVINHVNNVQRHCNSKCQNCANFLNCLKNFAKVENEKRYTIDIIISTNITEHQIVTFSKCPISGETLTGDFPEGVNSHMQYGNNLSSFIVLLNHLGLSCKRIQDLVSNSFNINLSQGTIINKINKCADIMKEAVEDIIKPGLCNSNRVHFDETSVNSNNKRLWVHSSSNDNYTYLTLNQKRGKEGIDHNGVLKSMKIGSYAIHDCWGSYLPYKNVRHVLCNKYCFYKVSSL